MAEEKKKRNASTIKSATLGEPVDALPSGRGTRPLWGDALIEEFVDSGNQIVPVNVEYTNGKNPVAACQRLRNSVRRMDADVSVTTRGEQIFLVRGKTVRRRKTAVVNPAEVVSEETVGA